MPNLALLLVQIVVILATARLLGSLFRFLHQPRVIGEMVAGILLGPSLLGWLAPGVEATLFPAESLGHLSTLSQIGLLVFMFLVGLELDLGLLRGNRRLAVIISYASIVAPFVLGGALAAYLHPRLADPGVGKLYFVLFVGIAMSVTAFPVLARILAEQRLLQTTLGTVAIAAAAVGDVTAWCLLAGVVALVRTSVETTPLWVIFGGTLLYLGLMIAVVRRMLPPLADACDRQGQLSRQTLSLIFMVLLGSAWITERLGIHALFGAFLAGAIMPKDRAFREALTLKLEDLVLTLLLPLFFAFTGLRTSITLIQGGELWLAATLIMIVAVAGKFGGATVAARLGGMRWRYACAIGVLMNTRGLIELVVLSIGLDIGIITPTVYTMMVLMALGTTFMTTPLLHWLIRSPRRAGALGVALVLALGAFGSARAQERGPSAAEWWDGVFRKLPPSTLRPAESFPSYCVTRALDEGLLKRGSKVLDLAMGDGRYAVLFARKGLDVTGLDISPVAIEKAQRAAGLARVTLHTIEADLFEHDLGDGQWDLVTNIYFNPAVKILERLKKAVRPGGLLLIEGFGADHKGGGPPPASRYGANQLIQSLPGWRILEYQDGIFPSAWAGDQKVPVVRLLARKPSS